MNHFAASTIMHLALLVGSGSLLFFGIFLLIGPPVAAIRLGMTESQALVLDAMLSILFFLQHSVMIRKRFRERLASVVPRHYHPAVYAIASGIVLTAVVLLWQPSRMVLCQAEGLLRWLARAAALTAVAGFSWGVRALESLDAFGQGAIRAHLRHEPLSKPSFIVRGPYLWVRHPLYLFVLVLIWSAPEVGLDRLLFNVLWTLWIVYGAHLEEKDLVAEFGEPYRRYQRTVPMIVPYRFPNRTGS